eukprot:9833148-Alexandrium_andersonii.AAC.1
MPLMRAPQLFSAALQEGAVAPGGGAREQTELVGCTGSTWSGSRGAMLKTASDRGASRSAGKGRGKSKASPAP